MPESARDELAKRRDKCFLCKWILEDLTENGRLTGQPYDAIGQAGFPVGAKLNHMRLEGILLQKSKIVLLL